MMRWVKRLKQKWGIARNIDFLLIMATFSLAGMMVCFCRPLIFQALGIKAQTPFWFKACVYIPLVLPLYQGSLLIFGTLLGQFRFFWEKQKHLAKFVLRSFSKLGTAIAAVVAHLQI